MLALQLGEGGGVQTKNSLQGPSVSAKRKEGPVAEGVCVCYLKVLQALGSEMPREMHCEVSNTEQKLN